MLIIDTNILLDQLGNMIDHQSRLIEIQSWDEYVNNYINNISENYNGTMYGRNFMENTEITNLEYDDKHLSCNIDTNGFKTIKLVYLVSKYDTLTNERIIRK